LKDINSNTLTYSSQKDLKMGKNSKAKRDLKKKKVISPEKIT
jgi:hypothetical protein